MLHLYLTYVIVNLKFWKLVFTLDLNLNIFNNTKTYMDA
jgi:hypothetical protein